MTLIIAALAVYKTVQVLLVLLPREVMPWVKVVAATVLSFGATAIAGLDDFVLSSLAVATLAGAVHGIVRLMTYAGDLAQRRSLK